MISLVTPAYNERDNIEQLYENCCSVFSKLAIEWEWLIIDDHSSDDTFGVAHSISTKDARVRVFRLSRNVGSHIAIRCGLDQARGDAAIVMAADLQDDESIIPKFIENWKAGSNVVWAERGAGGTTGGRLGLFSRLYYWLMRNFAGMKNTPRYGADSFLADKKAIEALKQYKESNVSIFVLLSWIGFKQSGFSYTKRDRKHGRSGWTLEKKLKLLVDSITSFSYLPIRLMALLGILISLIGFLYAIFIISTLYWQGRPSGWASLMVVVLVVGGLQMLMFGVLGEYLWRALDESRRRPKYIVEVKSEK